MTHPSDLWNEIGMQLAATAAFRRAVGIDPGRAEYRTNLGTLLRRQGRMDEAFDQLRLALPQDEAFPAAQFNMGCWWLDSLKPSSALHYIDKALAADPTNKDWLFTRACALLTAGRWTEAFAAYECRTNSPGYGGSLPLWEGQDLEGKTLLVHAEQGLGDTIMFYRFIKHIPATIERRVVVQASLTRLLEREQVGTAIDADYRLPIMSVPHRFGVTEVADRPYIHPDHHLPVPKPPGTKLAVGLVWKAKTSSQNMTINERLHGHAKSMPFDLLLDLCRLPGVALYGLQPGVTDIADASAQHLVMDLGPQIFDFADLASYIDQMDVIVSVDTAPAHLAGAMGKKVIVACHHSGSWQWQIGDRSDWYPTATIVRQKTPGDWGAVMDQVVTLVEGMLSHASSSGPS